MRWTTTRARIVSLFKDRLKDTAFIHIGRPETNTHYFTRVLHLIKDPHGRCFCPALELPSCLVATSCGSFVSAENSPMDSQTCKLHDQ